MSLMLLVGQCNVVAGNTQIVLGAVIRFDFVHLDLILNCDRFIESAKGMVVTSLLAESERTKRNSVCCAGYHWFLHCLAALELQVRHLLLPSLGLIYKFFPHKR